MHPIQQQLLDLHRLRPLSGLSYREIGRQLATDTQRIHPQTVKYHIEQLIKDGQLKESDRPASVSPRLLAHATAPLLVRVPVMGAVNAGPASLYANGAVESYISVSPQLIPSKNYPELIALRVEGDSMNATDLGGKTVEDGDVIVVDRSRRTPKNNEIVVVNHGDTANIKRIKFDYANQQIALVSESTRHFEPIYLSERDNVDAFVEGTVLQVIKATN